MSNIKMSKDFEQIRYTHDTFLTKIQSQCFMINKPVRRGLRDIIFYIYNFLIIKIYNCLNEIVEICLSFCAILNTSGGAQNASKDQIINITKVIK